MCPLIKCYLTLSSCLADPLIFCLDALWINLGSPLCRFEFLINEHNNLSFRRFYFLQILYSHAAWELPIPSTRLFSSVPAGNLKFSISLACCHSWTNQSNNCSKVQLWVKLNQSQLCFLSINLRINELPVKFLNSNINITSSNE